MNVFPTFFLRKTFFSRCLSPDLSTGHCQSPHLGAPQGRKTPGEGQCLPCAGSCTLALFPLSIIYGSGAASAVLSAGTGWDGGFLPLPWLWEQQHSMQSEQRILSALTLHLGAALFFLHTDSSWPGLPALLLHP